MRRCVILCLVSYGIGLLDVSPPRFSKDGGLQRHAHGREACAHKSREGHNATVGAFVGEKLEGRRLSLLRAAAESVHGSDWERKVGVLQRHVCFGCANARQDGAKRLSRALSAAGAHGPNVGVLGGSISAGGGTTRSGAYAWPAMLEELTNTDDCAAAKSYVEEWPRRRGRCVAPRVVSFAQGATSSDFFASCLNDLTSPKRDSAGHKRAPAAEDFDVWIVEFFVNDCRLGHHQAKFELLVRRLLALPKRPSVVLLFLGFLDDLRPPQRKYTACPPPVVECPKGTIDYAGDSVAASMFAVAEKYDVPVVDLRASFVGATFCGADDCFAHQIGDVVFHATNGHPNNLGHSLIALMVHDLFRKAPVQRALKAPKEAIKRALKAPKEAASLPAPLHSGADSAAVTTCIFAANVISAMERFIGVDEKGHQRNVLSNHSDVKLALPAVDIAIKGDWAAVDLSPRTDRNVRTDSKLILRLRAPAKIDFAFPRSVLSVELYHFAHIGATETLCCHPRNGAAKCVRNDGVAKAGHYVTNELARTGEIKRLGCSLETTRQGNLDVRAIFVTAAAPHDQKKAMTTKTRPSPHLLE
mmetsp:Transcript_20237/g.69726  ORF Transcript_20237/g.69726 Transcript_20237/m.69726 type:complete len:585 (+) Transcript_20237:57-1811(+)